MEIKQAYGGFHSGTRTPGIKPFVFSLAQARGEPSPGQGSGEDYPLQLAKRVQGNIVQVA